jgi:hypothetical protein
MQMMLVTELCDGGDLSKAMKRLRHTDAMGWYSRGAKLCLDVACGLAYLHSRGVSSHLYQTLLCSGELSSLYVTALLNPFLGC